MVELHHLRVDAQTWINQDIAYQTDAQSVTVSAGTFMQLINMAGIFDINLSEDGVAEFIKQVREDGLKGVGSGAGKLLNPQGSNGKKGGYGGSLMLLGMDGRTRAKLVAGVRVHSGIQGGLTLQSTSDIESFTLTQSGASAGKFGVDASVSVISQDSTFPSTVRQWKLRYRRPADDSCW